jgi:hypothetical protein
MKENLSRAAVALMALLTVSCGDRVKTQEVSIEDAESLYVRKPAMHLEGSDTSEEALAAFRTRMEERIRDRIMSVAADFNVYDYITCSRDFPYLNRQYCDVASLLPLLDSKSKPFLHYTVKDMRHKQPMQRYIFIHTDSPEEQAKWRDTYPCFFQLKPSAAETVSCFKLVVIQKQDIRKEDRV